MRANRSPSPWARPFRSFAWRWFCRRSPPRRGPQEIHLLDRLAIFWGLSYQTLDDLKDVLYTDDVHGKTAARDAFLDRPNLALTIGVPESFERIDRLMNLAGRTIARLGERRARLAFLREVRVQFNKEIANLSEASLTRAS